MAALIVAPLTAVATHSFTDVPNSHTFHDDIAWLADAGVTKGCNPPANTDYCPDDFVTRGQMAAFMHRLAENRVVDAGTVGSLTSNEITSLSGTHAAPGDQLNLQYSTSTTIEEITISARTEGFLFIQADASYFWNTSVLIDQWLQLDDTECDLTTAKTEYVDMSTGSLDFSTQRETVGQRCGGPGE